ncbi:Pyruvate kinase [Heracleum sosnowskyi]|uniref:Pyruvate kinase n=1 Tax=Heracleum sosnowskyi TaxID=360622 RepID=A0AAD8H3W6_9APIA|nr:Pyruvate kinase [Heracleum sosnowskyi]
MILQAVKIGDTIFVGRYLFTRSDTTSVWLKVFLFQKAAVYKCNMAGKSVVVTRVYSMTKNLRPTHAEATDVTNVVLDGSDAILLGAETLRELYPVGTISIVGKICAEVFLFQKAVIYKCNMAGKPVVVTRVDSMNENLRPTHAEATDVVNAVLDGSDAILLGAETLRGLYLVGTISIVGKICAEAEEVFNQDMYLKKSVKYVGEPMTRLESIASSAVRAAIKVRPDCTFTFKPKLKMNACACRLITKYRPTMPVLSIVIPRLKTNQLRLSFRGAFEARQSLIIRGLFPMLADPRHPMVENWKPIS